MKAKIPIASELPLWLQLYKVSKKYTDALTAYLGYLGIKRHYFMLVTIGESDTQLSQQDLADLFELDKVTLAGIVNKLNRAGFIRRSPSAADGRKYFLELTPKAEQALPKIKKVIADLNQRALSGLPANLAGHFPNALALMKAELEKAILDGKFYASESHAESQGSTGPKRKRAK